MGKHGLIVMRTLGMVIGRLGDVPVRVMVIALHVLAIQPELTAANDMQPFLLVSSSGSGGSDGLATCVGCQPSLGILNRNRQ
jgi:hypothetical protein